MGIVFALLGLAVPVIQMRRLVKGGRGLGHFAPVLSMGACCLTIWNMLRSYGLRVAHGDWSGLEDTYEAVNGIALTLLVITLLLNLFLAWAENKRGTEEWESNI